MKKNPIKIDLNDVKPGQVLFNCLTGWDIVGEIKRHDDETLQFFDGIYFDAGSAYTFSGQQIWGESHIVLFHSLEEYLLYIKSI